MCKLLNSCMQFLLNSNCKILIHVLIKLWRHMWLQWKPAKSLNFVNNLELCMWSPYNLKMGYVSFGFRWEDDKTISIYCFLDYVWITIIKWMPQCYGFQDGMHSCILLLKRTMEYILLFLFLPSSFIFFFLNVNFYEVYKPTWCSILIQTSFNSRNFPLPLIFAFCYLNLHRLQKHCSLYMGEE